MREIHIANSADRDATVLFATAKTPEGPKMGLPSGDVLFRRYLSCVPELSHEALTAVHGEDYGQALIDGDPEVERERVGRFITESCRVYLTSKSEVMYCAPKVEEVIVNPDGSEKERRAPQDIPSNANVEIPLTFGKKRMDKAEVARRFVFANTIQLRHSDGLTYDFLYGMAKELADAGQVALVGGGKGGKQPIVLQENGSPYRGFLDGRVDGKKYQLLLRLSRMELKVPAEVKA